MNMYIHMSIVLEELKKIPQYIYKNLPLDGNTNKKFLILQCAQQFQAWINSNLVESYD
jgi:hypothetical protein